MCCCLYILKRLKKRNFFGKNRAEKWRIGLKSNKAALPINFFYQNTNDLNSNEIQNSLNGFVNEKDK